MPVLFSKGLRPKMVPLSLQKYNWNNFTINPFTTEPVMLGMPSRARSLPSSALCTEPQPLIPLTLAEHLPRAVRSDPVLVILELMFQKSQKITKLISQVEEKLKYSFGD